MNAGRAMRDRVTRRRALELGLGGAASAYLAACGGTSGKPKRAGRDTSGVRADAQVEDKLVIGNWVDFQSPENLERFARQTGVELVKGSYGSEEELLAKLDAGGSRYDIVVPGSGRLQTMIQRGTAMALNHDLLPNLRHLKPAFADPRYDPGNRHSVPKDYGITSFWWRTAAVKEEPRTFAECFALLPRLKGARVNFIESSNETINAALAATGSSINATDDAALNRARDLLLEVKPYIDTISATYIERGQRGEIDFGLGYNGDVHRIQRARAKQGDEVKFLIPEGRAQSYVDLWVIPADAAHPVAAHKFINSILEPRAAAREMGYTGFGVPVAGVERYQPKLARDPVVSIPEEAIRHYEVAGPYPPEVARKRNTIYTRFKSA
jgi:spermidine/putrescine transport system substrate-binding protein